MERPFGISDVELLGNLLSARIVVPRCLSPVGCIKDLTGFHLFIVKGRIVYDSALGSEILCKSADNWILPLTTRRDFRNQKLPMSELMCSLCTTFARTTTTTKGSILS